jgi:hypothetical protein
MESLLKLASSAGDVIKKSADKACTDSCGGTSLDEVLSGISNTLVFLVGAVSVIFIIIGGLRYVTSNGDAKNIEAAKTTILYAVVGVIVAMMSYAIVQFIGDRF